MSENGTQTEHTHPTDPRAASGRRPPALSPAGVSGDKHWCHPGGGGHFLEGDPLPPLCQQGGTLCRCPEPPDAGAAGLFRETCGPAYATGPAIAATGTHAAFPRDPLHDEPARLSPPGAYDHRRSAALPAAG